MTTDTCSTCGSKMLVLFTSVECPVCDADPKEAPLRGQLSLGAMLDVRNFELSPEQAEVYRRYYNSTPMVSIDFDRGVPVALLTNFLGRSE